MNILYIHNFHRSGAPSGDDSVVTNEIELLRNSNHTITVLAKYNDDINRMPLLRKIRLYFEIPYSRSAQRELATIMKGSDFDIVHIHNIFPQFSTSIYQILKEYDIPFVHTLHDFRLFCANAFFFRKELQCELCPTKNHLYCIRYKCFQDSLLRSIPCAAMIKNINSSISRTHPDYYIALNQFAKSKLVEFDIPSQSIVIKPNFPVGNSKPGRAKSDYALFVGRFSSEKGIELLVKSLDSEGCRHIPVKMIGAGSLRSSLEKEIQRRKLDQIEILGLRSHHDTMVHMQQARFLILPSLCYENFPLTLVEAMSVETPVIASNVGALSCIVRDFETGILTNPGNAEDLAEKILWLWKNKDERERMGKNARKEYEEKYTPEKNYHLLMDIYERAIEKHKRKR